jgi:hypothetical protein
MRAAPDTLLKPLRLVPSNATYEGRLMPTDLERYKALDAIRREATKLSDRVMAVYEIEKLDQAEITCRKKIDQRDTISRQ